MAKTASFAAAFYGGLFVNYAATGSIAVGGAIALVEPAVSTLANPLHERVWQQWGSRSDGMPAPA